MNFLRRTLAIFVVATRRLLSQRGLALATALGLIVSVAIVMSIPLYTDAVYYQILQDELLEASEESSLKRPPFAFMFRYVGSLYGAKEWEDVVPVDSYLTNNAVLDLRLPHDQTVRYARTDNFRLFPANQSSYSDKTDPLEWVSFAFATDFADHITLLEGQFPAPAAPFSNDSADSPIEVLVAESLADNLGIQVGEQYVTFRNIENELGDRTIQIPVRVSGIWKVIDQTDPYWFYRESVFENQLFVPEATLVERLSPPMDDEIAQFLWYFIMDGSAVTADDVGPLISSTVQVQQEVGGLLADTRLEVSPQDALVRYRDSSRLLNVLLFAFSVPIVGLLIAFIGLVVGLAVSRQRNEIAVLRSRGATTGQIVGIATIEALILGIIALIGGYFLSPYLAQIIASTRSFLNFTVERTLRIEMTMSTLRFGIGAVIVTMIAQILPSIGASRFTIVSFKQEQARTMRSPWWQRMWLDVLLMIPVIYGTYLLSQQGNITGEGVTDLAAGGGPFENPLLFLIPALAALALTLLILRLLPILMAGIAWLAGRTESVGFLLATRYLARDPGFYSAPLVLLVLTLSLSTYTASLAQTLDNHLFDRTYYLTGADTHLVELGVIDDPNATAGPPGGSGDNLGVSTTTDDADAVIDEARWVFVPVSEHKKIEGIFEATRVGDYESRIQVQGEWLDSTFYGIDRVDFPKAAYWRRDFAPASLGALMNALAVADDGILLEGKFMRQNGISEGDIVAVRIVSYGQRVESNFTVVGRINYFPKWYAEENGPLIVGNMEYLFEQLGGTFPYDVWSKTAPGIDYNLMKNELRDLDLRVLNLQSARQDIADAQEKPDRQGLFGVLSIGFLAAALLTVLGFLLYALFSFRRRFIELGTLRAIGLSAGQMTAFLAWELIFLIVLGLGAGTLLGTVMSNLYIPYLQVGTDITELIPPFQVEIAWDAIMRIYALFGILFVFALSVLAILLMRMKIFQAIKLGETV